MKRGYGKSRSLLMALSSHFPRAGTGYPSAYCNATKVNDDSGTYSLAHFKIQFRTPLTFFFFAFKLGCVWLTTHFTVINEYGPVKIMGEALANLES
ncbi:hypothetical protein BDZ94DRAFT_1055280 [Collybia nuda]|uniref:Uncharacterized protein n=1 Tax=Collybia nuda TaxID=64659 RepID=A0A9P5Y0S8_9AGAR|nr:hypothetical protein BDZ94DRAFT_1055280 [Collybia nuda]